MAELENGADEQNVPPTPNNQTEAGEPSEAAAPKPRRPRAPRRRREEPAPDGGTPTETTEAAPVATSPAPEELLAGMMERELDETGEPVSGARRNRRRRGGSRKAENVIVPEAVAEAPEADEGASQGGLIPVTPEILAEVRGVPVAEVRMEPVPAAEDLPAVRFRDAGDKGGNGRDRNRGRDRDRGQDRNREQDRNRDQDRPRDQDRDQGRDRNRDRDRGNRQPIAAVAEETETEGPRLPALILVPEALLESIPEGWAAEDAEADALLVAQDADFAGRRGRGRRRGGKDRRDERPQLPQPQPAPTVTRLDEDSPIRERERRPEPRSDRDQKEILINVGTRETRIAVIENNRLVELHVEREERVVGGVYKGRVSNVLPGMDAAFVDIGLERNAFLYVGDILFDDPKGGGGDGESGNRRTSRDVKIKDIAKPGQELLVQVVKGPRGTKGARVSTKISIPGRYLVLMPEGDNTGVSRKIEDTRERDRLKRIAEQMHPKGFGLIVRTEAEGRSEQELKQDLDYLLHTWQTIDERNKKSRAPALIHADVGPILQTIRDLFGQDVDKLVIDDREEFDKIVDTLEQLAPDLVERVMWHDDPKPLFDRFNLEDEIDRLLRRKVWIRNGAYLLIDATEALTTIDVNTGKFVGTSSLAETILKTNLDAAEEIARQLRLRDIGGMIVLDFIDMASSRDRQAVMRTLENALKNDRTRIKIAHISPLGLVEMTRKRTAEAVTDLMSHSCPYCQGRGRVWSPETIAINIEREITRRCATEEVDAIVVYANPEVAMWLIGPEGQDVERLERMLRRPVYIRARQDFHIETFEVIAADMIEMEEQMLPYHGGQIVECNVTKSELITPPRSAAWVDGFFVDLSNGARLQGQRARVRLTDVRRSFAFGDPLAAVAGEPGPTVQPNGGKVIV